MNFQSGVPWYQLLFTSSKAGQQQNVSGQELHRLLLKSNQLYDDYVKSQELED